MAEQHRKDIIMSNPVQEYFLKRFRVEVSDIDIQYRQIGEQGAPYSKG